MKNKFPTMKKLITVLLLALSFTANAKTYYVSTNSGNDNNNGLTTSTPWKSLSKVNSFTGFVAGDAILLNRGEIFYGKIVIKKSGSAGSPITIGAYGTGAQPVISGFITVSAWTNLGSNIWESTNAVSTLPYTNMVVVNGVNAPMGRYPNSGFLYYQSHSGKSTITSSSLTGSPNWTGAELAFHNTTFTIARNPITAQSGGTLSYRAAPTDVTTQYDNQGFIIQNDPRTLDTTNEWYYNPSTKKLRIYETSTPVNVQLTTVDTTIYINSYNYITFDNISFQGSNTASMLLTNAKNITIQNCEFKFLGKDAVFGPYNGNSTGLTITNCTFNHINNNAIFATPDFDHPTISSNTVKNCGMQSGMGSNGDVSNGSGDYSAINVRGANALIAYNLVDSIGYIGIRFYGSNTTVQNNYVSNFCLTLHDGGGLYTWNGVPGTTKTSVKVINNIVLNSATDVGIYLDDNSNNMQVSGNTVANCTNGIYLHSNWNMNVFNNTTFNNSYAALNLRHSDEAVIMHNNIMKNNIFFAKTSPQRAAYIYMLEDVGPAFISDSNYYAKPINQSLAIDSYYDGVFGYKTLAQVQAITGQEAHSKGAPKAITDTNDLRFEFNATSNNKTISLDANYIDVRNVSYNGTITLAPYTSAVLMKNGPATNQSPTASAGNNQTITLPTTTVSLSGSGTDPDGTIVSYSWTKISGPASGTITSATSAATTVTSLTQGVYQFQLKVTDNKGGTGLDIVQVTVNNSGDISPVAHAGGDQTIVLPTTTLNGSGTDADGTIVAYTWTELSGPAAVIVSPNSASTLLTGLLQGTYQFQLMVTDNLGTTAIDVVLVTVNLAESLLPAVNPANTVNGLDYKYYQESDFSVIPVFSALTPVKTGTSTDFDISVADRTSLFAFNFTGFINVPSDGQYTFYTTSDDGSNLYIDNVLVVDNGGLHGSEEESGTIGLKAGKHAISVGYTQQGGGSTLNVSYDGPGISKQDVPLSALYRISSGLLPAVNPANTVNGLDYKYYESASGYSSLPIFSNLTPVKTGSSTNFDISLADQSSTFSFSFSGFVNVPSDGQYTFYTTSDDGSYLAIDGIVVVNNDGLHGPIEKSGTIGLQAGKHAIAVGYFQQSGSSTLIVSYSGPGVSKQAIPASALYRISGGSLAGPDNNQASVDINNQAITSSTQVGVKAYPNPFANYIQINITGNAGEYKLMLVDVSGKIIWTKTGLKNAGAFQQTVNTSALQRGIYFLKIIQNNDNSVIRLVK